MATTTSTGSEVPHGADAVFPPFDPANFASLLFWLAITFAALYAIISRVAIPRITKVLEERANRIQRDLDEAQRLKDETEKAIADYETALATAHSRGHAIGQESKDKIAAEVEQERAATETALDARLADANARIEQARTAAMSQVAGIGSETAASLVDRLIGSAPGADEVSAAVARAVQKS